jgi:hypothetical protein
MNLKPPLQALAALVHVAVGKCAPRRDFASNRHNIILKPCELVLILFRLPRIRFLFSGYEGQVESSHKPLLVLTPL